MKVDINSKGHLDKLLDNLDTGNIKKSKIVGLLPQDELLTIVSNPCFVKIYPQMR